MPILLLLVFALLACVAVRRRCALVPALVILTLAGGAAADPQFGMTNGPAHVTGQLQARGSTGWVPEKASPPPAFDADPSTESTLTLSGSTVTHATSRGGGAYVLAQSGSAPLPALDTTDTIGGHPTLSFTATGALYSATGPTVGSDAAFNLYAVAQLTANVGTSYPAFMAVGAATPTTDQDVYLGGRTSQWWAGCQDATLGAVGGTVDGSAHEFGLEYDGAGHFILRIDGVVTAGPTSCTFNAHSTFPVGFGIAPQYSGNTSPFRVARAIYRLSGADSTATRIQHERYLGQRYAIVLPDLISASGDSLTAQAYNDAGVGDPTHAYIALLSAQTGMGAWTYTPYNDGHPGWTSSQLLAGTTAPGQASPLRRNNLGILFILTNDMTSQVAPATVLANIASIYSNMLANGFQSVVVMTGFPWSGWVASNLAAINSGILSTYPHVLDLGSNAILQTGCTSSGGGWNCTYDDVYRVASGTAIGHLTATGENYVASLLAPILLSLKMEVAPSGLPSNDNALPLAAGLALIAAGSVVQRRRRARASNPRKAA